jgi:hypothetical protein
MSTSSLPTLNDPVEFIDPPPTGITVTAETQALPAQQAIPDVAGALPALQAIPQQAAVPTPPSDPSSPPTLHRSERQHIPRIPHAHLADVDIGDDGELEILQNIEHMVAESPEDDDGAETALMAQLNTYLADNPINVEYPDNPRNYREAMAAPNAPAWIAGTHEELKGFNFLSARDKWERIIIVASTLHKM